MKTTQRRLPGFFLGISLAILIAAGAVWWGVSSIPPLQRLFPPHHYPLSISFLGPEQNSSWPADAFVPIRVLMTGAGKWDTAELWVNGNRVETKSSQPNPGGSASVAFDWLPAAAGHPRILVNALKDQRVIATSNLLHLEITDQTGIQLRSDQTHPDIPPQTFLPLEGYAGQPSPITGPLQQRPQSFVQPQPLQSDFRSWLQNAINKDADLPEAPGLTYSLEDCELVFWIEDHSLDELGFFLYRAPSGSSDFTRVAALGPSEGQSTIQYSEASPQDGAIYYVSAFNTAGEAASAPVMLTLSGTACSLDDSHTSLSTLQDDLDLLDLAYFYYSFNGRSFQRYPADQNMFLTPSAYSTPLEELVAKLAAKSDALVSTVHLVIWGWEGGSLVNLGAVQFDLDDSRLEVCNLGTNCTGDVAGGFRATYGELANDQEDQSREFYWLTNAPGTDAILWQVSSKPFPDNFSPHPYGLLAAGCAAGSTSGSYLIDFSDLPSSSPPLTSCGTAAPAADLTVNPYPWLGLASQQTDTTYYIRFTPMAGNQPSGRPSNTVELYAHPGEQTIQPVITDHLPEIYDLEIVDFTPIHYMDPAYWGCMTVLSYDYNTIWNSYRDSLPGALNDDQISAIVDKLVSQIQYAVDNNLLICPTDYQKEDQSILGEWADMFTEGLGELWGSITSAFNSLKAGIVELAVDALGKIGIPCNSECKLGLTTGLEIGMTYFTGIPPTLPDFDQLADQGINYAIELAAAEAGVSCPEICQDALRSGLKDLVDQVVQSSSQPACVSDDWAHALGKNPVCLPPGIETSPYQPGVTTPASAAVRITRRGNQPSPKYSYFDQASYLVKFEVTATNNKIAGQTIPFLYQYWGSNSHRESFTIDLTPGNVAGHVFQTEYIPVPPLAPGESIEIPISLRQAEYYLPGHVFQLASELSARGLDVNDVGGLGGVRGPYFDWNCLHQAGLFKIEANMLCLSTPPGLIGSAQPDEDSSYVPCGASSGPIFHQQTSDPCYP